MRHFVDEDQPAAAITRDVHDLVSFEAAATGELESARSGLDRQDASLRTRRILEPPEGDEQHGTDQNPRRIEEPEATNHGGYDTDRDPG